MPRLPQALTIAALICTIADAAPTKRIVFQLRDDDRAVTRVILLTTSSRDEPQEPIQVLAKARGAEIGFDVTHWYIAAVCRLGAWNARRLNAFQEIPFGASVDKYRDLKVRDLQDGDIVVLHHPYP